MGVMLLAVLGASYQLGPYTITLPEGWTGELHGTTEESSILYAYSPGGDTLTLSHAKIPGFGLLGGLMSEKAFVESLAKGNPPEGCQGNPEVVEVNGHPVVFFQCEGKVTAQCAPDMKALLTIVAKGPAGEEPVVEILEASFK